jgi:UDP-N-acetylglucosamine 1-carboxyvinyltransferase
MIAPALAGGQVDLIGGRKELLGEFWYSLERSGLEISETVDGVRAKRVNEIIKAVDVKTKVYPGFATDLQAQFMALMCLADGTSHLEETLFENRFMHAPELMRMGAKIDVQGGIAKVQGVSKLKGAPVMATDLRASVSLILAGLAAEGETKVARVYHLDRGYENLVRKLSNVGANIERISD